MRDPRDPGATNPQADVWMPPGGPAYDAAPDPFAISAERRARAAGAPVGLGELAGQSTVYLPTTGAPVPGAPVPGGVLTPSGSHPRSPQPGAPGGAEAAPAWTFDQRAPGLLTATWVGLDKGVAELRRAYDETLERYAVAMAARFLRPGDSVAGAEAELASTNYQAARERYERAYLMRRLELFRDGG